jgi:hypothetical protein
MRIKSIERISDGSPRQESRFSVLLNNGHVVDVDRSWLFNRGQFCNLVRTQTHESLEDPTLGATHPDREWRDYIGSFLISSNDDDVQSPLRMRPTPPSQERQTLEVVMGDDYALVDGGGANAGDVVAIITTAPGITSRMLKNLFANPGCYDLRSVQIREAVPA